MEISIPDFPIISYAEMLHVAALLHDIGRFLYNAPVAGHASVSARQSMKLLKPLTCFTEDEKVQICTAIANHSDKQLIQAPLDEILKDADLLASFLTLRSDEQQALSPAQKLRLASIKENNLHIGKSR